MNEEEEKMNHRTSPHHIRNPNSIHEKLLKDVPATADFIDPLRDERGKRDSFKKQSSSSLKGTQSQDNIFSFQTASKMDLAKKEAQTLGEQRIRGTPSWGDFDLKKQDQHVKIDVFDEDPCQKPTHTSTINIKSNHLPPSPKHLHQGNTAEEYESSQNLNLPINNQNNINNINNFNASSNLNSANNLLNKSNNYQKVHSQGFCTRLLQGISQGLNLGCFCYFYCFTVTNSMSKRPFSGMLAYVIGSLVNLNCGSSRFVVFVPSFLAIAFMQNLQDEYSMQALNVIAAFSGIFLLAFAKYLTVQRLIFFVPATVLLGYVYGTVFQFSFSYFDLAMGFHSFQDTRAFMDRIQAIFQHLGLGSLWALFLTISVIFIYLFSQSRYLKFPWMLGLVLLSLTIGFAVTDSSLRIDTVKNLYKDTQPKLTDLLSYLTSPFLAASSFRFIHLTESLKLACLIYLESLFTLNFSEKECSDTDIEPQREVLALAIANILSGVFCGIPVSAGIFSTTINGVLIRKTSKYPRLTSLIFTISMELFVVFFSIQIPYLAFATVLIGAALFTLQINLYFHASATSRNLEVWMQALIGFFYHPVLSAVLGTAYSLLHNELHRYTLHLNRQSHSHAILSSNVLSPLINGPVTPKRQRTSPLLVPHLNKQHSLGLNLSPIHKPNASSHANISQPPHFHIKEDSPSSSTNKNFNIDERLQDQNHDLSQNHFIPHNNNISNDKHSQKQLSSSTPFHLNSCQKQVNKEGSFFGIDHKNSFENDIPLETLPPHHNQPSKLLEKSPPQVSPIKPLPFGDFDRLSSLSPRRPRSKQIKEKYNMLNDQLVEIQDTSQAHPNNFDNSFDGFSPDEFASNKFMVARYNPESQEFQEYRHFGLASFLREDSAFLIQTLEGQITSDHVKFLQDTIGSKLFLSPLKYRAVILQFYQVTFYDMNSLFQIKHLLNFLRTKSLPVLVTGLPEQLAEDLYSLNEDLFKSNSIILELIDPSASTIPNGHHHHHVHHQY